MPIQFTRKGRYEVWRDGLKISEHNQEREATEQIINHSSVYGDGDYEIKGYLVVARVVGSVNPQTGDTTPPTTPGSVSASATSATTGTVTWTASTDASGVAGYQIFLDGAPLSPTTTNLSYSLTGLSPSTQYAVTVVAFDAAGNNSVAGGPALFTTDANSAPVWSLGNQAYETGESVSISLDTVCTDADGDTITYSLVSGSPPSGLALSGPRSETLSGTVDTVETAVFTLGASDGVASVQNVALTFTITAPDTVAPAAPTGLSVASTTSSSINLDWADNAESDLASYDVYRSTVGASGPWGKRNGAPLTSSNYQDSGLNELTQYWYYVTATDNSGNESTASSVVSSTTSAANAVPYDLGTLPTATIADRNGDTGGFEELQWPNPPVTTQTINVTNTSELITAAATPGALINIAAGTYTTDLTIREADQDFVWDNAAILNGDIYIRADLGQIRTRWTGGVINGFIRSHQHTDILFNNIRQEELDQGNSFAWDTGNPGPSVRMALINSTFNTNSNSVLASAIQPHTDLIIANNYIHGGKFTGTGEFVDVHEPPIRIMNAKRVVIVDNLIKSGDGRDSLFKHTFRFHRDSDLIYFARNLTLETGYMSDNILDPECDRVWIVDNQIYHRLNSLIQLDPTCRAITASGNEAWSYYNSGPGDSTIQALQGWPVGPLWNVTNGGGVAHPYDASAQAAAEAAWTGGADH